MISVFGYSWLKIRCVNIVDRWRDGIEERDFVYLITETCCMLPYLILTFDMIISRSGSCLPYGNIPDGSSLRRGGAT